MSLRRLQISRGTLRELIRQAAELPDDLEILTARFVDPETVEFLICSVEFLAKDPRQDEIPLLKK